MSISLFGLSLLKGGSGGLGVDDLSPCSFGLEVLFSLKCFEHLFSVKGRPSLPWSFPTGCGSRGGLLFGVSLGL